MHTTCQSITSNLPTWLKTILVRCACWSSLLSQRRKSRCGSHKWGFESVSTYVWPNISYTTSTYKIVKICSILLLCSCQNSRMLSTKYRCANYSTVFWLWFILSWLLDLDRGRRLYNENSVHIPDCRESGHRYPKLNPWAAGSTALASEGESNFGSKDKRNKRDFALWKASKAGEPSWPSPWGRGRPGKIWPPHVSLW